MSNYIVITYDEKDEHYAEPKHIERIHYSKKEDVMKYILDLRPKVKYEIYKEVYLDITEEEA